MSSEDAFRQCAELLLRHRLAAHARELDEKGDAEALDRFARGSLINEWTEAFQSHGERVLSDLLVLAKTFDARSTEWVKTTFAEHVDEAATSVTQRLGAGPAHSAEHKKVLNLASTIKTRGRDDLARAFELASKLEAGSSEDAPGALDGLLPLQQRSVFERDIVRFVKAACAEEPLSLLMVDLDHFKQVNDVHGHQAGDEVLIGVSNLLVSCLSQKGKAYRYGGEELVVLLPNYSLDESAGFGERIRKEIESAVLGRKELRVTASLGLAAAPPTETDARALLEHADEALYEAKRGGRNQLRIDGI